MGTKWALQPEQDCKVRSVSSTHHVKPGYVVTYPNRDKSSSERTKLLVVTVLVVSTLLMLLATFGGWSKLEGLIPLNIAWCLVYLVIARYVMSWARGLLPIAAALGALMLTFTLIAVSSLDGVTWSDRGQGGYASAHTVFGSGGLSSGTMSVLTITIAVSQALLIIIAMRAFGQAWNIELEMPAEQVPAEPLAR
jgi:hypothetical protein